MHPPPLSAVYLSAIPPVVISPASLGPVYHNLCLDYNLSRKIHLLRLYLLSIFMTVFSCAIDYYLPTEQGYGFHNIFLGMFLVGVLVSTIETFQKDRKKGYILLGIIFAIQVLSNF